MRRYAATDRSIGQSCQQERNSIATLKGRLEDLRIEELAEQFLLARPVFRDDAADPGRVHVVLDADVFAGDIPAPRAAAKACRLRHPVGERAGVTAHVWMTHHDPA